MDMLHKVEEDWRIFFYNELIIERDMHSADDLVMCLVDFNGHMVWHIDGIHGVHGWYGVGKRDFEGGMLLEFCLWKELCVKYMA